MITHMYVCCLRQHTVAAMSGVIMLVTTYSMHEKLATGGCTYVICM